MKNGYTMKISKILSVCIIISLFYISCNSGENFSDLTKPFLITPINGLMTSSVIPFFVFRHTNPDQDGIYYEFLLSDKQDFSNIVYFSTDIIPYGESIIVEMDKPLLPGYLYFYKLTAREYNTNSQASSDTYHIYIEYVGDNIPNLYMSVGDSITYSRLPGQHYPDFLIDMLKAYFGETSAAVNEGIPGLTAHELINMIEGFLLSNKPSYTIILIGINDIRHPGACPNPWNCQTLDEIIAIANICIQKGSIPIICNLIPALGNEGSLHGNTIFEFNENLKNICRVYNFELIDLYKAFMDYSGDINSLYIDDLHPNASGNKIIANTVFDHLAHRTYNSGNLNSLYKENFEVFINSPNVRELKENPFRVHRIRSVD